MNELRCCLLTCREEKENGEDDGHHHKKKKKHKKEKKAEKEANDEDKKVSESGSHPKLLVSLSVLIIYLICHASAGGRWKLTRPRQRIEDKAE